MGMFLYCYSFLIAPSAVQLKIKGDVIYVCDAVFWGSHCIVSIAAIWVQERTMRQDMAGQYERLLLESSILPRFDRIFSMSLMEMRKLALCMIWSFVAVAAMYFSPFLGFSQSACGGWVIGVYALAHCTRDLMLEQMFRPVV